ncbi:MAG: polyketide synthase, partial [Clostridiales bacterium]|nr:polyketide synthase [Clostridiales bacterium]
MKQEDIAIVGMSIYCPGGDTLEEFWSNLANGVDCIIDAPDNMIESFYFDEYAEGALDRYYCRRGGFCRPFKVDPLRYGFMPVTIQGIEPEQMYSLAGVEQALDDAGVFEKKLSLSNCSIIIGRGNFSGIIPLRCAEYNRSADQIAEILRIALPDLPEEDVLKAKRAYQGRLGRYKADSAIGTMPSLVASLVANKFNMHGPAYTIDAACASGIVAIEHSSALLMSGQCDIAVAGGIHLMHSAMFWSAFNMMGAISHKQAIAPFSRDADGLLVGQGAGFVVIKTLKRAIADGDRIYAVIKGTAISSDGKGTHVMVTSVDGEKAALAKAWKRAGLDPMKDIGLIEAHGTGTPVGDRNELTAMTEFFGGSERPEAFIGSVKSNLGHTMPAAGMIGFIKATLALYHRKIPPTLHCENPLDIMESSRFSAPTKLAEWDEAKHPLVAGVNAFGFGGVNSHAVLAAYAPPPGGIRKPFFYYGEAIVASAESQDALVRKLQSGDYTHTGGDWRIAMFNPTEERLKWAVEVVQAGAPWRGRLDIWFTNKPLLR